MELRQEKDDLRFLENAGEMGELVRSYDWASTSLGMPHQWPRSLQITVSIVLHSAFPMFLFWGKEELICFYNDAFRPSLGNEGKHPAIGKRGKEVWADIWEFAGPLIHKVMTTGEAVWYEDQLVPFFRNGRIEDIYWTFSYSPVYGDEGNIDGCFVTCTETTPKISMLKTLSQSEQRFQNLVREASVGIVILKGENFVVEVVNDAYGKLIDRTIGELLGKPLFDVIPETADDYRGILDNVRTTGEPMYLYDAPYAVYTLGKKIEGLLNLVYQPYRESDGRITGVMVLCHDVSDRLILHKKAEETEHLLRSVVENAPFPIGVYTGREMRISLVNKTIMDVWGKGYEVVGKTYHEVLPELADQNIYPQLDDVYTKGIPFHARNQRVDLVVGGKLQPFYFNYSFTPIYDSDGKIYGVMNTAAEVTDIVVAKQQVEQSEQNFKNMILQAPVAMCILTGPDHIVEIVNDLMIELWGKPVETVMNKPVFDALPDAREQGLEALMKRVYETGESFHANERPVELIRKGKLETTYQNFVYEPYKDAEGKILGILAITINVTEQVMARQKIEDIVASRTKELAEANANLKRSNEELAQFAYIASHDLQEPLRKVSIFTQMLENHLHDVDDRSRGYFDKIKNSSARMLTLIRDVLAYSQLSRDTIIMEQVDLNKIVADISNDFELLIQQTNATIQYDHLPVIEAIPLQMSQLFSNLISNALKFIKPGTDPVITITAEPADEANTQLLHLRKGTYHHLKVADNGIGFNQEKSDQIFNIFQRLHGKKEYQGTGIGLAMCRKIAQNHHGAIYAISSEGKGTVFHIILPAAHSI
jgi:hypothetical protein